MQRNFLKGLSEREFMKSLYVKVKSVEVRGVSVTLERVNFNAYRILVNGKCIVDKFVTGDEVDEKFESAVTALLR